MYSQAGFLIPTIQSLGHKGAQACCQCGNQDGGARLVSYRGRVHKYGALGPAWRRQGTVTSGWWQSVEPPVGLCSACIQLAVAVSMQSRDAGTVYNWPLNWKTAVSGRCQPLPAARGHLAEAPRLA